MKKIATLLGIICFVLAPLNSFAQKVDRTEIKTQAQTELNKAMQDLTKSLKLSEKQIPQVEERLQEYFMTKAELTALKMNSEDLTRRMTALNESNNNMMGRILSPDQMQTYLKYNADKK